MLASAPGLQCAADEGGHERVGPARTGARLRHEQRHHVEAMAVEAEDPRLPVGGVDAGHAQAGGLQHAAVLGVQPEPAVVPLDRPIGAPHAPDPRIDEVHLQRLAGERAEQLVDEQAGGAGVVFGVLGVGQAEHVASELDDAVLEAGTGAEEGDVALPRPGDPGQRAGVSSCTEIRPPTFDLGDHLIDRNAGERLAARDVALEGS